MRLSLSGELNKKDWEGSMMLLNSSSFLEGFWLAENSIERDVPSMSLYCSTYEG